MSASNDLQTQTGTQLKTVNNSQDVEGYVFSFLKCLFFPLHTESGSKKEAYENEKYTDTSHWLSVLTHK